MRDARIKITAEQLAALSAQEARARRSAEQAWEAAFRAPPPAPAFRADAERGLRSLALGLASACAFVPAALLSDGEGQVVEPLLALRNVAAVLALTLLPAWLSAREERSPEAEDAPRARFARRFSPLLVGFLLVLTLFFPYAIRWKALEAVLLLQAPFALFVHVPRVRAIVILAAGWAALAGAVLDDRAAWALVPVFGLVAIAAALDRTLDVRSARPGWQPPPNAPRAALALPIVAACAIFLAGALAFSGASALLPPLERTFPVLVSDSGSRPAHGQAQIPLFETFLLVIAVPLVWALWHILMEKLRRKGAELPPEELKVSRALPSERLPQEAAIDVRDWPEGPRLRVVRRYLEHLRALVRRGVRRSPGQAPLDVARAVTARAPAAEESAARLARAFHEARYSPLIISPETAAAAENDARAVEDGLAGS
ncbi:DUF4129 domain-containing protein [bacterium]|nr:DUF4129 domain-containing protein [bacterium]